MLSFLLVLIPLLALFFPTCHVSLFYLRKSAQTAELPFSPTDLSIFDIFLIILVFVARSVKFSFGFGKEFPRRLAVAKSRRHGPSPGNHAAQSKKEDVSLQMPPICLAMPLHIRPHDIAQYISAINKSPTALSTNPVQASLHPDASIITTNSAHLSLFLSAISEPALLLLLARKNCPIRPLGAVNVRNRFEVLRPDLCRKAVEQGTKLTSVGVSASAVNTSNNDKLAVYASFQNDGRRVKRGVEIDVLVTITVQSMSSSKSEAPVEIFKQIFTILSFLPSTTLPLFADNSTTTESSNPAKPSKSHPSSRPQLLQTVSPTSLATAPTLAVYMGLAYSAPQLWAKLCKDYNPIHLSSLAARIYGFRGKIAHGNHVVAMAIGVLPMNDLIPGKVDEKINNDDGDIILRKMSWMEVRFKRPIVVPVEVGVRMIEDLGADKKSSMEKTIRLEVFREDKVLVEVDIGQSI